MIRVMIEGDSHLSSKDRGNHVNYPKATLEYFAKTTEIAEEYNVDYIINLGDFAYGNFNLKYRAKVDELLNRRDSITGGKCLMVKGNHDISTTDMSEFDYYVKHKKMFNKVEGLENICSGYNVIDIGNIRFHLMDYNCDKDIVPKFRDNCMNILLAHKFIRFKNSDLPPYGEPINLDNRENWYGFDFIVCGHIHQRHKFTGCMKKGDKGKDVCVYYPGSLSPTDRSGIRDTGEVLIIDISESDESPIQSMKTVTYDLWGKEEAYTGTDEIEIKKKVNISDVIAKLNDKERNNGDAIDVIRNMADYKKEYRDKAIELLMRES